MLKNLQNNLSSASIKRGIKSSVLAVATICASSVFAQDATITAPGAFTNTVPASQNSLTLEIWGGGGSGGAVGAVVASGSSSLQAGGGGGGGYSMMLISVTPGDTYSGTVAAGAITTSGGADGKSGGNSSVTGPNITGSLDATGGLFGQGSSSAGDGNLGLGGAGGTGTTAGQNGSAAPALGKSGKGGDGGNGGPGGASVTYVSEGGNLPGIVGTAPGGAGSGAVAVSNPVGNRFGKPGGAGADGQAKFTYSTVVVLSVSLANFDVKSTIAGAELTWSTVSEANNNRFEVLRSTDNKAYVKVATVAGNGTTTNKSFYTAKDNSPEVGINYYKLVQIDNDGTQTVVAIKSLNFSFAQAAAVSVYPNPASGVLNVNVNAKTAQSAKATLIGSNGSVALTQVLQLNAGANTANINLSGNVAPGQYILTVAGTDLQESVKVIVK